MSQSKDTSFCTTLTSQKKPKAPLSAYNIFFQLERSRILNGTDGLNLPITPNDVRKVCLEHKKEKRKRLHRKSHGKIGFADLARTIASRWRKLDPQSLQALRAQASLEKDEYANLVKSLQASQEACDFTLSLYTSEKSITQHHEKVMEEDNHCCLFAQNEWENTFILNDPHDQHPHLCNNFVEVELLTSIILDDSFATSNDLFLNHRTNNAIAPGVEALASLSNMDNMESADEIPFIVTSLYKGVDVFAPLDPEEMDKLFDDNDAEY